MRRVLSIPVAIIIGLAIHLDWHLARPMDQRLSAGWSAHWILAVPLFVAVAWYFARRWPVRGAWPLILTVSAGIVLGEVLEPLLEVMAGDTLAEAYQAERVGAFVRYLAAGLLTLAVTTVALHFFSRPVSPR